MESKTRGRPATGHAKTAAQRKAEQRERQADALSGTKRPEEWSMQECLLALQSPQFSEHWHDAWTRLGTINSFAVKDDLAKRSIEEIEQLKRDWLEDQAWDIEGTDGFEAHRYELLAFSLQHTLGQEIARRQALQSENQRLKKVLELSKELNCNGALAEYLHLLASKQQRE